MCTKFEYLPVIFLILIFARQELFCKYREWPVSFGIVSAFGWRFYFFIECQQRGSAVRNPKVLSLGHAALINK